MAAELDMERRDPQNLNEHIQVHFEDVLGEPDDVHSMDCAWAFTYKCFNCSLSLCYRIITAICCLPCSFCWACNFATTAFCHIWYCTPYIRCFTISLLLVKRIFHTLVNAFFVPLMEALSLIFSRIHLREGGSNVTPIKPGRPASPLPTKSASPPPPPPQALPEVEETSIHGSRKSLIAKKD